MDRKRNGHQRDYSEDSDVPVVMHPPILHDSSGRGTRHTDDDGSAHLAHLAISDHGLPSPQRSRHNSIEDPSRGSETPGPRKRSILDSLRSAISRRGKPEHANDSSHHKRGESWSVNSSVVGGGGGWGGVSRNNSQLGSHADANYFSPSSQRSSIVNGHDDGLPDSPAIHQPPPPPPIYDGLIAELAFPPSTASSQFRPSSSLFTHIDNTLLAIARLKHANFQVRTELSRVRDLQASLAEVREYEEKRRKENITLMNTRQPEEWRHALEEEEQQLIRWSEALQAEDDKLTRTLQEIYEDRMERDRVLEQTAASLMQDKAEVAKMSEELRIVQAELDARNDKCERLEKILNGEEEEE